MTGGIRAEVSIDGPDGCPIASVSGETATASYSVSKSVSPDDPDRVTEEFVLEGDAVDSLEAVENAEDAQMVFSYGDESVYRFTREREEGCPCERVEQFDCPVVDVHTRDGTLYLAFHAADMEALNDALTAIRERYPNVQVQRLLRSSADRQDQDLAFVDRSVLTERQREVLQTAHDMGYFAHPKGANAGEVAAEIGISPSTLSEHLAAAQSKLLDAILEA